MSLCIVIEMSLFPQSCSVPYTTSPDPSLNPFVDDMAGLGKRAASMPGSAASDDESWTVLGEGTPVLAPPPGIDSRSSSLPAYPHHGLASSPPHLTRPPPYVGNMMSKVTATNSPSPVATAFPSPVATASPSRSPSGSPKGSPTRNSPRRKCYLALP